MKLYYLSKNLSDTESFSFIFLLHYILPRINFIITCSQIFCVENLLNFFPQLIARASLLLFNLSRLLNSKHNPYLQYVPICLSFKMLLVIVFCYKCRLRQAQWKQLTLFFRPAKVCYPMFFQCTPLFVRQLFWSSYCTYSYFLTAGKLYNFSN